MKRKVQYYETDMMGVTHHANYIRWMEEARIDFMDRIGFPYTKMEAEGIVSPVKSLQANYLKPCTFGDEVDIKAKVRSFDGVVLTMEYRMAVNGEAVFSAVSEHVFLTREGRIARLKRVLPDFCAAIGALLSGDAAGGLKND